MNDQFFEESLSSVSVSNLVLKHSVKGKSQQIFQ
jgi:hypothetical protein